ncbi:MAG: hypothetical protein AAFY76_21830, partial [Cyanobacteria bacterium J06649_11]
VNLFKFEFPDAKSDLKPWTNDEQTMELVDPDSIDIGFHFPGVSSSWQSRSILTQIRFYQDQESGLRRAIGVEVAGFDHRGERWRLSTVENWNIVGKVEPSEDKKEKLKHFCRQVLEVFNSNSEI